MFPPKKAGPPALDTPGKRPAPAAASTTAPEPEAEAPAEDYAAKLLGDMTKPLVDLGMEDADARATLADIFEAVGRCLRGDSGPVDEHDAGGMPMEGGE